MSGGWGGGRALAVCLSNGRISGDEGDGQELDHHNNTEILRSATLWSLWGHTEILAVWHLPATKKPHGGGRDQW